MSKFATDKPKLCEQILQNHISTNTEEQKQTFVRSMQRFRVFDENADKVINSHIVNQIDVDNIASDYQEE